MEIKSSTEYSIVFLRKQIVQVTFKDLIFVVGSVLRTGSVQRLSSQYFAAVPISNVAELGALLFFLSTTMVFAAFRTHFPKKNTRVYRTKHSNLRNLRKIESIVVHRLNSQHLAMVWTSNMAELVPSGIFCLQPWFLRRTEYISLRKTPVFMSSQLRTINNCLSGCPLKNRPLNCDQIFDFLQTSCTRQG